MFESQAACRSLPRRLRHSGESRNPSTPSSPDSLGAVFMDLGSGPDDDSWSGMTRARSGITERASPPLDAMTPKKKPQPFRAGALRCRRGGGRGADHRGGGTGRTSSPPSGSGKNSGLWKKGGKNEAPRMPRRFADSCRFRRLSPVPDSPIPQNGDSGKRLLRFG